VVGLRMTTEVNIRSCWRWQGPLVRVGRPVTRAGLGRHSVRRADIPAPLSPLMSTA
jgi:hypothetical protein